MAELTCAGSRGTSAGSAASPGWARRARRRSPHRSAPRSRPVAAVSRTGMASARPHIYILHAYRTCRQHCRVVFDGIVRWYSVVGVVDRLLDGRDDYRSIRLCSRHGKKTRGPYATFYGVCASVHTLNLLARGIRLVSLSFRQWMPSRISTPPGASCFRMPCPLHMLPTAHTRHHFAGTTHNGCAQRLLAYCAVRQQPLWVLRIPCEYSEYPCEYS